MAGGNPTGADLCSGTTDGDTLPEAPNSPEEREITIDVPIELTEGEMYAIVARAPDASGYVPPIYEQVDWVQEVNGYEDGNEWYSNNGGTSWTEVTSPTRDQWFKTLATGVVKDSNVFAAENSFSSMRGSAWWRAQTFIASSTYIITSVILKLRKSSVLNTPGTVTVGIRAVAEPVKPTNPTPGDTSTSVTLDQQTITWEDGGAGDTAADSYNVYYGENAGSLSLLSEEQVGLSFSITGIDFGSPFAYAISRAWRVDAINEGGVATGDVWTFTTITFAPPSAGSDGKNIIRTVRRLLVAAANKIYYEDE